MKPIIHAALCLELLRKMCMMMLNFYNHLLISHPNFAKLAQIISL